MKPMQTINASFLRIILIATVSKRFCKYIKSLLKDHIGIPPLVTNEITITKSKDKAETLNQQFYSVFTDEDLLSVPIALLVHFLSCQTFLFMLRVFISFSII